VQHTQVRGGRLARVEQKVLRALETAAPGGVLARSSDRLANAHDASHYLLTPQMVVRPTGAAQVAAVLRVGAALGLHLTFRSGGTSLSGQASSEGVLVDTRHNFREIEVLDNGERVRAQPGATVRQVNARLSRYRRKLGPDPASEAACTIGGVVANNSSGMACGTEFNTYRTLESVALVLATGTVIDSAAPDADTALRDAEPHLYQGLVRLRDRLRGDPKALAEITRQYSIKNTMGYGLNAFADFERPIDILVHLIVGSEGTLAFVAEATFRTVPVMQQVATGLLVFDTLRAATAALPALVATGFATIELLDAHSLRVAQRDPQADQMLRSLIVREQAALLVEFQEATAETLAERLRVGQSLIERMGLVAEARLTQDVGERAALWHIRKGLYPTVAGARPSGTTALLEDIAVPVGALLETCEELVALFSKHDYEESVIFGHAKDGNIHFMLNERFDQSDRLERYLRFTEDLVTMVLAHGGTLKAEHGTGRMMAPYVRRQYGDDLYAVMREVKRLCDPLGLLNPGVLINEEPLSRVANLKTAPTIDDEVDRCVECGYCEPVCPSRDVTVTPRQRIVLRREMETARLAGEVDLLRELEGDYQYDGVDTCAADGMCQTACPVLIDTGELVKRLRSERTGAVERKAWTQAARHWEATTQVGSAALSAAKHLPAPLVVGASSLARTVFGADSVPQWESDLPGGGNPRKSRHAAHPRAVYFSACISAMFGPAGDGEGVRPALIALCERAGVELITPEGIGGLCCGTPWRSKGFDEGYESMRARVLPILWEASRHGGLPVVCDAASCTEGLVRMAGDISQSHFEGLRVIDAVTFVDETVLPGLRVPKKLGSLALHPTCSSTRLGANESLSRIAFAVADDVVVPDDWGCCGFAGDRGMLHPKLTASATAREARAVLDREYSAYASANRTCEIGMTRATGHQYQHVLEVLERATRPVGAVAD
jgi:D-lactate dehydrogenase